MKMNMKKNSNHIPHASLIICVKICVDLLSGSGEYDFLIFLTF